MIKILISEQRLLYYIDNTVIKDWPISTSKYGTGFEFGSEKTPYGNFLVFQKIGLDLPINTIFKGRKPIGIWDTSSVAEDLVLTRVMWLHGLDEQNKNTKERFIYIHGTNHENDLGKQVSHGCTRMANQSVIELFDFVSINETVVIEK